MNLIRATLGCDVHLADPAAVLGLKLTALDLKLLECIERWQQQVGIKIRIGVFNAVQSVVVVGKPLACDVQGKIISGATHAALSMGRRRTIRGCARNQRCKLQVIAAVERQILDPAVLDNGSDIGGFGLQYGRTATDLHDFTDVAYLE